MNRLVATITAATLLAYSAMAGAQTAAAPAAAPEKDVHVISTQDLDMLRKNIRSKKKQLMA
jgi:Spy/CpxP family protein refolding chaperone